MKRKNRKQLLNYILQALDDNEYKSYSEIQFHIEEKQNNSLDCYDIPTSAIKSVILDYGIYSDGEKPERFKGNVLFIANNKKDRQFRIDNQIKWKKYNRFSS